MRLHRHDEIVETMARAIYDNPQYKLLSKLQICEPLNLPPFDKTAPTVQEAYRGYANAALDAFLEEVVKLGVGKIVTVYGENLVLEMETEK
jgi:hypothetical protein